MGKTAQNPGFLNWYKKLENIAAKYDVKLHNARHRWFQFYAEGLTPQQVYDHRGYIVEDELVIIND